MYLTPLSPVLQEMLTVIRDEQSAYLHTSEAAALKKFFVEKIAKNLLERKKMLIVLPDAMDTMVPVKLLSQHHLAHFTLDISDHEVFSKSQLDRLKRLEQLQEVSLEPGTFKTLEMQTSELQTKIRSALNTLHEPTETGPSFKNLILDVVHLPDIDIPIRIQKMFSGFSIDQATIANLNRLQQYHKSHYNYIDHSTVIAPGVFEDQETMDNASAKIQSLYNSLTEVLKQIEKYLDQIKDQFYQAIETESHIWLRVKDELELSVFEHSVGEQISSFEEVYISIFELAQPIQYLKLDYHRQPSLNWAEAPMILDAITSMLNQQDQIVNDLYERHIGHLTPFNVDQPELGDAIERATSILRAIGNCKVLDTHHPKRYLQVAHLIRQMRSTQRELKLSLFTLKDTQYCKYRKTALQCDIPQNLLWELGNIQDSSWKDLAIYYARKNQISKRFNKDIKHLPNWYLSLRNCTRQLYRVSIHEIHNRWCKIRNLSIAHLKNEHWELYHAIWNQGEATLNAQSLYRELGSHLSSFCPILITRESDLKTVYQLCGSDMDEILYLESRSVDTKIINFLEIPPEKLFVLSSYNMDIADWKIPLVNRFSSDMELPTRPLHTYMNSSDRYRQAVSIAGHLADLADHCSIYKYQNKIIVSFVHPKLNDLITQHLDVKPQHFLYRSTIEIGHFVEALMSDQEIVLLGENQLINDLRVDSISWQQHIIQLLKKIEIKIYTVATADLYEDRQKTLTELVEQLQETQLNIQTPDRQDVSLVATG